MSTLGDNPKWQQAELLTCEQTAKLLMCSKRTIWRLVRAGEFPSPKRWNRKFVRWIRADVLSWIQQLRKEVKDASAKVDVPVVPG